jgi:hypothetical protein
VTDIPPDTVLPCGCILRCSIEAGVNTLTVIPCKLSCVHYRNMLGLADERDVPVTYKEMP